MITDNLASLFDDRDPGKDAPAVKFRQGIVVAFNPSTGQNTISVGGGSLDDVPMLNTGEAVALKPGHVVGLLLAGKSWFIIGRVTPANDPNFASASVAFGSDGVQVFNFALTTSPVVLASSSALVVPQWADEALVFVGGSASVINPLAVKGTYGFRVGCSGGDGGMTFTDSAAGFGVNNAAHSRNRFVGLNGGEVLTITGEAQSLTTGWALTAGNAMFVHAIALYKSNV